MTSKFYTKAKQKKSPLLFSSKYNKNKFIVEAIPDMPRKVKKLTPEELEEEFKKFKETEEYELWTKANTMKNDLPAIDTGTKDMTNHRFQELIDEFTPLMKKFKGKPKKELKHEYFRGFFYGSVTVNVETDKQTFDNDIPFRHDGRVLLLSKSDADAALKARSAFLDIYNCVDFWGMLDEKNFMEKKKEMLNKCKEFAKHYDK